jgi:hypothetical protein
MFRVYDNRNLEQLYLSLSRLFDEKVTHFDNSKSGWRTSTEASTHPSPDIAPRASDSRPLSTGQACMANEKSAD